MTIKTATKLAIFGAFGLAITFAIEWIFQLLEVTSEFYSQWDFTLRLLNLLSRICLIIFFIILHKNQK
jgi:hypothetical protein